MKSIRFTEKSIPALFAIVTIAGYGLLLPFTGFYWDDWPFAWIAKFLGPREFIPAFASFRPFLGPIFFATTSLIPPVPLYWQIFALIIRFIIGLAAWWMFKQIWPERPRLALTASLFMLVFPGYSQHWVAFTHINQELIPFIFYLLSFGFTFKALRAERPLPYTILALLLQLCGIFPTEYFFGIEGIRFLFLLFFFQGNLIERVRNTFKRWWPYLLVWILNAAWLVYYYKFGPYSSYEVTATQSLNLVPLLLNALDSLWKAGFYVWIQILVLTFSSISAPASLLTFGLIAVSFALLCFHGSRIQVNKYTSTQVDNATRNCILSQVERTQRAKSLIIIGILSILLGRLPSLAAGLPLTLQSSYDRFMISMMIGGSLFVLGVIELLFGKSKFKPYVIALIISLGIGQQFFNANIFRRDWSKQRDIYWQLAWRVPALEPNTVLLTDQMPIDYETDISFTAPINWMYAPNFKRADLPYLMLYTEKRLNGTTLPSLDPNTEITFPYRTVTFHGNTSQAVVIYMPQNGCLRALDPSRGDAGTYARQSKFLVDAIPLSNLSRIITNSFQARPEFTSEPKHGWCYYFAKAELAQQMNDMEKVVALGNEAMLLGFAPEDPNEWLVFIEANALTGNLEAAQKLSTRALGDDARAAGRGVCNVWKRVQAGSSAGSEGKIVEYLSLFGCPP